MGGYSKLKLGYYLHALGKKNRVARAGRGGPVDCYAGIGVRPYDATERATCVLRWNGPRRDARHEDASCLLPRSWNRARSDTGSPVFS